jgi:hypothetical protein
MPTPPKLAQNSDCDDSNKLQKEEEINWLLIWEESLSCYARTVYFNTQVDGFFATKESY